MFNVIEKHQKAVKGLLMAITATFVVWGVSGYLGMAGDDGYVAKVGNKKIYQRDIDQAIDQSQGQQQDNMQVLFGLVNRQLLINALQDNHMTATDEQLRTAIAAIPAFQTNGQFDATKYEDFLKQQYMTPAKFQDVIAQQVVIEQMLDFFKSSYFTSNKFESQFIQLLSRERNVTQYVVSPSQFMDKINISESDITAFYQQHIQTYTLPEEVKLQYIQLSAADIAKTITISDSDIDSYMQAHPDVGSTKEVDVSHILFSVPSDATATQKAEIKAKAEGVLAQIKANPTEFAALATKYSQDPGSAAKGGELGYFGKGVMVPAFESTAFSLKQGQVSGLVETQFGYHILKLNAMRGGDVASAKSAAKQVLQKQKAQQELQKSVDKLNDLTYNNPNNLDVAAKDLNLSLQSSDWLFKNESGTVLANPKIVQAIFTDDVMKSHHNSEVVDLGDGSYFVARIVDYKGATTKALSSVRDNIATQLKQQQAAQMASSTGQQELQNVQSGKIKLSFTNPTSVSLLGDNPSVDPASVQQIFAAPKTFPSYAGAVNKDGAFVIYQVSSEKEDPQLAAQNQKIIANMNSEYSMMSLNAYVGSLRNQYDVVYKLDRIKKAGDADATSGAN